MRREVDWRRVLPLAMLVAASTALFVTGTHRLLTLDHLLASRSWLQESVAADRPRAMLVTFAVYVGAIALSVPVSAVLTTICGFLFGWAIGAALAVAAATTGAIIVFSVARSAFADALAKRAGPRLRSLAQGFERDSFSYILVLRLLPIVPFWVTNIASAVFGARLRAFAPATLVGIVPACLTFATAGAGIDSVVAAHEAARAECLAATSDPASCMDALTLRALVTPQLIAALAGLACLAILPVVVRQRRRGRPGPGGAAA